MTRAKKTASNTRAQGKDSQASRRDPKPGEIEAMTKAGAKYDALPFRPALVVEPVRGNTGIRSEHNDEQGSAKELQAHLGSRSVGFASMSLVDLVNIAHRSGSQCESDDLSQAIAFIAAVEPQNELESALAQQMYSVHRLAMTMAIRAGNTDRADHLNSYVNAATKLQRTFTTQMETLAKWRRGGEQVVRHIHVDNRGGQAIIAETVNTGGAESERLQGQVHGSGASGIGPALLGAQSFGGTMPSTRDQGQEALQKPWGAINGSAEG